MLGHPRGVAPERVSKTDATDGSVRDRQSPSINEGLFQLWHHGGEFPSRGLGL